MPWVVRLPLGKVEFPGLCAFCSRRPYARPETIQHRQEKWSVPIGTHIVTRYLVYDIQVPSCERCWRVLARMRTLMWATFLGFVVLFLCFAFLDPLTAASGLGTSLSFVSMISMALAMSSGIALLWKGRGFRVAKVINGQVTYALGSRAYAQEFAAMNGVIAKFRLYAGRIPFLE